MIDTNGGEMIFDAMMLQEPAKVLSKLWMVITFPGTSLNAAMSVNPRIMYSLLPFFPWTTDQ